MKSSENDWMLKKLLRFWIKITRSAVSSRHAAVYVLKDICVRQMFSALGCGKRKYHLLFCLRGPFKRIPTLCTEITRS